MHIAERKRTVSFHWLNQYFQHSIRKITYLGLDTNAHTRTDTHTKKSINESFRSDEEKGWSRDANNSISNDTDTDLWSSHHISPILFYIHNSNQIERARERAKNHLKEIWQSAVFKHCGWMKNQFILYFVFCTGTDDDDSNKLNFHTIVCSLNQCSFFLHSSCAPRITHLTLYIFYATINHFPCCFWRSPFIFYYYVQYNNV